MDEAQDWHDRARMLFWVRSELAQSGFENARFEVEDSEGNYSWWNLTFAAGTWTRQALTLSGGDGGNGALDVANVDLTKVKIVRLSFEAKGSDTFYQEIDFIGVTPQAVDKDITVKVDGTEQALGTYLHTVSGALVFSTAPGDTEDITVTYDYYAITQLGGFFNWSITQAANPLDKTDFQSAGWKEFLLGLKEWSASAERHWLTDESLAAYIGVTKIIKLFCDANSDPQLRWEGWAIVTGLNPSVGVDTIINESLSFQGTGQLSYESE
jgi:predicted secreted protein